ncbi:MAG: Cof-type HAD-IIB family hydrolase [Candidatus Bipolaricaulaceae bacterium]
MSGPWQLFVFDLDGTLLGEDHALLPRATEVVAALRRRAQVTLATGRSLVSARPFLDGLHISIPAILYNGAMVYDPVGGRPRWDRRLPQALARRALEVARKFPVHPQLYRDWTEAAVVVSRVTPAIQAFLDKEQLPARQVGDLTAAIDGNPLKLLMVGEAPALAELAAALQAAVPELSVVQSEQTYLEVLAPGTNKGAALSWLCDHLGVPPSAVVAVGDQRNDLPMIELAGLGVAMAHAPQPVCDRADLVIASVEELPCRLAAVGR